MGWEIILSSLYHYSSGNGFKAPFSQKVIGEPLKVHTLQASCSLDLSLPCSPTLSPAHHPCQTTVLVMVLHAGSILDTSVDLVTKKSDISTFRAAFEAVVKQHYPSMAGHVSIRLVTCPPICSEALAIVSK